MTFDHAHEHNLWLSEILEEANTVLKEQIHRLEEERDFEQFKLKEITDENAQLIVDKQNT